MLSATIKLTFALPVVMVVVNFKFCSLLPLSKECMFMGKCMRACRTSPIWQFHSEIRVFGALLSEKAKS